MSIQSEIRDKIFIIRPIDSLNKAGAEEFEELIRSEIDEGIKYVVFDLSQMAHSSSDGLRAILRMTDELMAVGGGSFVVGLNPQLRSVFNVSGLLMLIEEADDLDSAISQLNDFEPPENEGD